MAYGGADLSTYNPNPSIDDYSQTQPGTDWSSILNTAGQWGATIAAVAAGNSSPAYTQGQPNYGGSSYPYGSYPAYGVPGSGAISNQTSKLLILVVIVGVVYLLVKK